MPLYTYLCANCGDFDDFNSVEQRHTKNCPTCGRPSDKQLNTVRLDYYNMGVSDSFPTALQKWEKMHKKEARRKYE